jgi:8-amino-3,8-dideoxy-alpha-D-manno-octulosonate transaminase
MDANLAGMGFRKINDAGECATLLTVIFDSHEIAAETAAALGTKTVSESGWHVYNNMEQILAVTDERGRRRYRKNMLPQTDDILGRAVNISIGVVDPGIGAGFGVDILSDDEMIDRQAQKFVNEVRSRLQRR